MFFSTCSSISTLALISYIFSSATVNAGNVPVSEKEAKKLGFLAKTTEGDRQKFIGIAYNFKLTKQDQENQLRAWAAGQSPEVQKGVQTFVESIYISVNQAFQGLKSHVTKEAVPVVNQIQAVFQDKSISIEQSCKKVQTILTKADSKCRWQLRSIFYCNVVVEHTGEMLWVPPAIYKSSCTIDVEYFPLTNKFVK
uniref:DUF148 domain-containing protein n=1 Tax=Ditylenchus dipsaci TaxID=166011 RepID=A0A915ERB8_9BILA